MNMGFFTIEYLMYNRKFYELIDRLAEVRFLFILSICNYYIIIVNYDKLILISFL